MSELKAGVGRAIITPPIGIPMVGFAGRGPAESVHDDLLATALVLAAGDDRAVILAVDLLGVSADFTSAVRAEIERRTATPAANVLLCASHTHYGPATDAYGGEQPPDVRAYQENLKFLLAGAAQAAVAALEPVRVGYGTGTSAIGVNRRERRPDGQIILGQNPAGACDREVRVVRLERESGEPVAAVVDFACHPVSAASQMRADLGGLPRLNARNRRDPHRCDLSLPPGSLPETSTPWRCGIPSNPRAGWV